MDRNDYARDVRDGIDRLKEGLNEIDEVIERLKQRGNLEWAIALSNSVDRLLPEVERFVRGIDRDQFTIRWGIKGIGQDATVEFRSP